MKHFFPEIKTQGIINKKYDSYFSTYFHLENNAISRNTSSQLLTKF